MVSNNPLEINYAINLITLKSRIVFCFTEFW